MDYERLRAFRNSRNPFSSRLGIYVEELRPGYARAVKTVTEEDLNPVQVPHGGVYFSLADTACGSAMVAYGSVAVTINCSFSFLKSAAVGDRLTAEARELQGGRSVCVLDARVMGEDGTLFAAGPFTFRRLEKPIEL
ncbi:MAG: PaaI family thioesterase [Dysosmobacter sp.]|nr:PaaI family thioesterase [Dysosmobacter sp.]